MVQSLGLQLDTRAEEPLYQQLFDQVAARIRNGAFPAGFRLPPTRALAARLGTHRNTVVRAYEDLLAAGFLESTVGRGTFVAKRGSASAPPRAGTSASAPVGAVAWSSLMARTMLAESFTRLERLHQSAPPLISGSDAINLAKLEPSPDQLPDDLFRRCTEHVLRAQGGRVLRYAARDGLPRLRAVIAEDLAKKGVPAPAEDILITSGSQQALDLFARALVNPGDTFLVDELTFHGAINVLNAAGARIVGVPSDDEGPDLAVLERLGHLGAKGLYLMPNSHNPTGARISATRREALIAWSRRTGVPLIEDDFVDDLELDGGTPPAALRALDRDVIYIGSFSKRLAPALRVGFMVVPPALRPRLVTLKYTMDCGTSELLQQALAEFLERGYLAAHLGKTLPEYRKRREALEAGLARGLPRGMQVRRPAQGLWLWLPLPPTLPAAEAFAEAQRRGVVVHPSTLNASHDGAPSGLRVTFCSESPARLHEGARRLGRALAALSGRERSDDETPALGGI
jgi:GntR family transcriptional regulator/MocR family aminotransferase